MNKRLLVKSLICLATAYFTLLLAFVVPLHQHNDFKKHDDCAICAVSFQPSISITNSVEQVLFVLLLTLTVGYVFIKSAPKINPNLRGPPIA